MSALWHFYWPILVAAVVIGVVAGTADLRRFRSKPRFAWLGIGAVLSLAIALAWHGPGGAAERLARSIERSARTTLVTYEMPAVTARLDRAPLERTLILSGPGNDFQQRELVRIMDEIPGVAAVEWDRPIRGRRR